MLMTLAMVGVLENECGVLDNNTLLHCYVFASMFLGFYGVFYERSDCTAIYYFHISKHEP